MDNLRDNLRDNFREGKTGTKIASGTMGKLFVARDIEMARTALREMVELDLRRGSLEVAKRTK